ncbi:hypothetical protein [Sphingobacterium psychroaquaticum]|uniref:Uncharacterized protein n=1 Tax=Sphingobacterium psychroaquaticum TaxID=561061 RepID=A0A1X7L7U8_9SPHI|nr:hypothetical protein [Sphingobacterium psychroaquaticum]QBQ42353.1 hypothetical protein E2P86_14845 [Sphingobacterium psychroaquaticum]SMG49627.1 hypothetical protein SAMN05660862_3678 [Sphingobacterium psychroaquaticum]
MKLYVLLPLAALFFAACQNGKTGSSVVGNDRDSQGCIPSAGYQWSVVQQKCVRPWEGGVKMLLANAPSDQQEKAVYALIDPSKQKAEIFIPETENMILDRVANFLYSNEEYQFIEEAHCWSLVHNGQKVYEERK